MGGQTLSFSGGIPDCLEYSDQFRPIQTVWVLDPRVHPLRVWFHTALVLWGFDIRRRQVGADDLPMGTYGYHTITITIDTIRYDTVLSRVAGARSSAYSISRNSR